MNHQPTNTMDKLYWIVCEEGDKTLYEGRHQARTRGAALKFLKEQVGRSCLRGVVFTITEIPVPLIREIVAEILAGGDLPVAVPTPPPAVTNDTATPEPAPKPARKSKPKPAQVPSDGKPGNPGFGDDLWQQVRAHWEECRNYRKAAEAFGLSYHTVKTRARREGWNK